MKTIIQFSWLFLLLLMQCNPNTLNSNEIALKLVRLENEKIISQSDKKNDFFRFLDNIYLKFESYGYGHRIKEMTSTWNLYEDKNYLIMTGSVAKSDKDIYIFTMVFDNKNNGTFEIVYEEVDNIKSGNYPKNIIPYSIK